MKFLARLAVFSALLLPTASYADPTGDYSWSCNGSWVFCPPPPGPCLESCREWNDAMGRDQPADDPNYACAKLSSGRWICARKNPDPPGDGDQQEAP